MQWNHANGVKVDVAGQHLNQEEMNQPYTAGYRNRQANYIASYGTREDVKDNYVAQYGTKNALKDSEILVIWLLHCILGLQLRNAISRLLYDCHTIEIMTWQ